MVILCIPDNIFKFKVGSNNWLFLFDNVLSGVRFLCVRLPVGVPYPKPIQCVYQILDHKTDKNALKM